VAVLIANICYGLIYLSIGSNINLDAREAISITRKLLNRTSNGFLIHIEDNYRCAVFEQTLRASESNAFCSASDYRYLVHGQSLDRNIYPR
jgi:hypothetical protein